ncbi:MAG TPA: glycerol-3-phosphate 1-O-acyltransferase PlsY [Steroidobacteraceae bacterium]|nr:glycerol-3-phosphate 1-O-acyltransferase PlsY [Steroidobacteraceae bacterium]
MIELIVKALLAYLIGSLVGSLLIGKLRGVDIRTMGSGNAGATNMLRTQGKVAAIAVLLIDLGKGWVATGVLAPLALPGIPPAELEMRALILMVCGLAVIVGHVYPLWYGFRGGKGVATFLGAVLGINAALVLVMVLTWLVVVVLIGFVGLASMVAAGAVAVAIAARYSSERLPLLVFGILAALLILYTHRANIGRMLAGTESRAKRLWLFGLKRGQS